MKFLNSHVGICRITFPVTRQEFYNILKYSMPVDVPDLTAGIYHLAICRILSDFPSYTVTAAAYYKRVSPWLLLHHFSQLGKHLFLHPACFRSLVLEIPRHKYGDTVRITGMVSCRQGCSGHPGLSADLFLRKYRISAFLIFSFYRISAFFIFTFHLIP